jgi:hypothetical protein
MKTILGFCRIVCETAHNEANDATPRLIADFKFIIVVQKIISNYSLIKIGSNPVNSKSISLTPDALNPTTDFLLHLPDDTEI